VPASPPSAVASPPGLSLRARLLALSVLLVGEYLLISLLFDARALYGRAGISGVLGYLGDAATIALVVAAATLALMGPQLRAALQARSSESLDALPRRSLWLGLAAHGLAYAALLLTTHRVFDSGSDPANAWIVAWAASACAVAGTWLPLALPWPVLRALAPRLGAALLLGTCAGVLAWLAGEASASVWTVLSPFTLAAVAWLLELVVDPVIVDPSLAVIGTAHFEVTVAPVCSGFEGIGLIVTFLGGYMIMERKALRFPHVLALVPLAVVTVWCANALRIALLVLVGSFVSPELAIGGFHSKAGWLFFCAVALGFVALARRTRYFATEGREQLGDEGENVAAPYLAPLLALLAAGLITGLLTVGFDRLYPVRMACVLVVLFIYGAHYRRLQWGLHWDSVAIGLGVCGVWYALARGGSASDVAELEAGLSALGPGWSAIWILSRVVGMALVVPIAEELAFRGYLLRRLSSADFDLVDARRASPWAWLVSSAAFGVLHSDWIAGVLAGLAYALAQQRRGRVSDAIIAHAVTNLVLAIDAWLLGNLRWWA
jgi:exosortase E/protease (VPEID-CTERM system)